MLLAEATMFMKIQFVSRSSRVKQWEETTIKLLRIQNLVQGKKGRYR